MVRALAVALSMSFASPARAGSWKIIDIQDLPTRADAVTDTKIRIKEDEPNKSPRPNSLNETVVRSDNETWWTTSPGNYTPIYYAPVSLYDVQKVSASVEHNGKARTILQYVRSGATAAQRAADVPDPVVFLRYEASGWAESCSDGEGSHRIASAEQVVVTVDGVSGVLDYTDPALKKSITVTKVVPIVTNGSDRVEGPWCELKAKGWIGGGRSYLHPYYGSVVGLEGWVKAGVTYRADLVPLSFTPNPKGLDVMNCSYPTRPLNQYLLTDNLPGIIHYGGSDGTFLNQLASTANWTITSTSGPLLPLYTRASNGNEAGAVFYRHEERRAGASGEYTLVENVPGMRFVLPTELYYGSPRNRLPNSNSYYGPRTITHKVLGTDIPAPIALFYPSTATNHANTPPGPPGYTHNIGPDVSIDTPNWLYYYNQAYAPPCLIYYSPPPSPGVYGYYTDNDPFVRLCRAHGTWVTAIFRKNISGTLQYVGKETVRGLDTYARILRHEFAHKRCYEAIRYNGMADTDGDEVPDLWEGRVGLTVSPNTVVDTTGFVAAWGSSNYTEEDGDSEAFARLYEEGLAGVDPGKDWADDGINWGTPAAPNRCTRTALRDLSNNSVTSLPGTRVTDLP